MEPPNVMGAECVKVRIRRKCMRETDCHSERNAIRLS